MEQTWANSEEFLNNDNPNNGQGQIKEEDYKSLQSEFTKSRQNEIRLALKLAEKDKKSILEIEDKKIQSKVIKELYWLDNLEELKTIHWNNFYDDRDKNNDDEDELAKIKKELDLMKFHQSKNTLENAIEQFKKENKDFFTWEEQEYKLREELKYISTELSPNERINRAFRIAFWINPTDAWYLAMRETIVKWWNADNWGDNKNKTSIQDEISSIFRRWFEKKQ